MEVYEENIKALKKYFKDCAALFEVEKEPKFEIQNIETKDGNHALVIEMGMHKYRLNSLYHPLAEAEKWIKQFNFQDLDVNFIMFGFGNGLLVKEVLKNLREDGHMFVFEPEVFLMKVAMQTEDLTEIFEDSRFHLFIGKEMLHQAEVEIDEHLHWLNLKMMICTIHIAYNELYEELCIKFWESIHRMHEQIMASANANALFARRALKSAFANLKYVKDSNYIAEFKGKIPKEIPVIIVSAGPSLNKNVEFLREATGKALIMATDTAIKTLEKKGIPYDCVVTADTDKPIEYFSNYPGCKTKPLFCQPQSGKDILAYHTGRKIWIESALLLTDIYRRHGMVIPPYSGGGSVATLAFSTASLMGIRTIILIGQDLAYFGDATHADGFNDAVLMNKPDGRVVHHEERWVEGIDGNMIRSRSDWTIFLHWFEGMIEAHPEMKVIDATEGGALIHGSMVMTLKEAIQTYAKSTFSMDEILENVVPTFQNGKYEEVEKDIKAVKENVESILKVAIKGENITNDLIEKVWMSTKEHDKLVRKLGKINTEISEMPDFNIVEFSSDDFVAGEFSEINHMTENQEENERKTIELNRKIYRRYEESCRFILECWKEEIGDCL